MQNKRRRAIRKGWNKGREIPAYATPYFEKGKTSHAPKTQLRTVIWLFCFSLSGGLQFKRAGAQKLLIVVINRPGAVTEIFTKLQGSMKIACFDFWAERSTTRVDICSLPPHSINNYLPQLSRLSQVTWKVLRLTASQTSRRSNEVSETQNNWAKFVCTSVIYVMHSGKWKKLSYFGIYIIRITEPWLDSKVTLIYFALNGVTRLEY